jgi:acyl-CoA synthetase (NDP forming)
VLLHPGSSAAGGASAATHTGAMAGDYQIMRTKVKNAGVVFVDTLEQLVDASELMVRLPAMPVGGAAILAESGAYKAMALDFCEKIGLELPPFTPAVDAALRAVLPDFIPPTNPMDLTAQALVDPDIYRRTLPLMIGDPQCGSLVLTIILTDESTSGLKIPPILEAIRVLRTDESAAPKPIIFAGMDEGARILPEYIEELRSLGVTFFPTPERALRALSIVTEWSALHQWRAISESPRIPHVPLAPIPEHGVIPEYRSKEILKSVGIPIPEGALAHSLAEATKIAQQIGFPVVLKAQSANLSHKSDIGGVVLNLKDAPALADGWAQVQTNIARKMPELILDGILVEKMGAPGVELIVGARNDPDWGPVALVGLGGVLAEALHDIRLLPPDLPVEAIVAELYKLNGASLLRGFRGTVAMDVRAAAEIISRLGRLVLATSSFREVDLNPVILYPNGEGAVALDALIVTA